MCEAFVAQIDTKRATERLTLCFVGGDCKAKPNGELKPSKPLNRKVVIAWTAWHSGESEFCAFVCSGSKAEREDVIRHVDYYIAGTIAVTVFRVDVAQKHNDDALLERQTVIRKGGTGSDVVEKLNWIVFNISLFCHYAISTEEDSWLTWNHRADNVVDIVQACVDSS